MRLADENKAKAASGKSNAGQDTGKTGLFSFHPTKEQKDVLRKGFRGIEANLEIVCTVLARGNRLVIGRIKGTDNLYAIVKEDSDDWQKAQGVSVVHDDPAKLIAALAYYLEVVNPSFPKGVTDARSQKADW